MYNTGILLYSESDLQHADFWVKSEGREQVLSSFQESWRLGYIHFAPDYAYTLVQCKIMFLGNNDMVNCHTLGLRFPMRETNVVGRQLLNTSGKM